MISLEEINLIKEYANENRRMAQDTILLDPTMHPERNPNLTERERSIKTEECIIDGTIYSSKFHAACEILALLGIENDRYEPVSPRFNDPWGGM